MRTREEEQLYCRAKRRLQSSLSRQRFVYALFAYISRNFREEKRLGRPYRNFLDLGRSPILRRQVNHYELVPVEEHGVSGGTPARKKLIRHAAARGRAALPVQARDRRDESEEHLHSSPRRRLEVERHSEAVLFPVVRHARILESPKVDPVSSEPPAAKGESGHAKRRAEPPYDGAGRVGREQRENEAVMVKAEVAVKGDNMRRCFSSSEVLHT